RMKIHKVVRAKKVGLAEIVAPRKQRVEGSKSVIEWIGIATCNVCAQSDSRMKTHMVESVARVRCGSPGANVARAEVTKLVDDLVVVVERLLLSPDADAQ